jgi:phosphatidylinositol 4-kinase
MEHQNMKLPELKAPDLLDEDQESGSDSEPIDTFQDAKQEPDELQIPLSTIPEHGSPSSATQDEQDPSSIPGKAESGPKEDIEQQQLECSEPCDTIAAHVHQETIACPELPVTPRKAVYEATRAKSDETDMPGTPVHEKVPPEVLEQSPSAVELTARDGSERIEKRGSKKKSTLGGLASSPGDVGMEHVLAPTGDVRREVLTAIMMRGMQGKDAIAIGAADSVQRSLKELERQRATELLLTSSLTEGESREPRAYSEHDSTRDKLASLGIGSISPTGSTDEDTRKVSTEEDEVMESIRLLLIQNRVAQGQLSEADAALVLQHTSLSKRNSSQSNTSSLSSSRRRRSRSLDRSEMPTIDAGDVDIRLVGCGALPPAILQALTLWRAEMVNNAELLELVKKDLEFLRHSVLHEAENMEKLHEDSAFWGRFAFGERWAEKKSRIAASSPEGSASGWDLVGVIVKSNDDLRQESFVMQLIELCQEAFELAGLELWVNPYRVLATGRTTGVIEMVRNAMSFDALKKRPGYGKGGLREHLHRMTEFTADPGDAFKSAQQNFVRSLAAYSLLSYLFQFKDRHNGNLLLDTAGHVIHIDFGFVFGIAPGGSFSLEMSTPFKLTEEMLDVMGGLRSPLFSEFVTLFCCGFLALQPYSGTFLTIVDIMCRDSTFKCFEGRDTDDVVSKLRERFAPDLSKEETVSFALDLIRQAVTSYGTKQYDLFQYLSQGIAT